MQSHIVTVLKQLVRDELTSLRRLAIDRRLASIRLPRMWRSALLRENPMQQGPPDAALAAKHKRDGAAT